MEKMSKSGLVDAIAREASITKAQARAAYDALVKVVYAGARGRESFPLPGLGKFVKGRRAARAGRNPKTGEAILIPASAAVRFKLAKRASAAILGK